MTGGNGKLVTIFGGSGFVGRHVVRAFAKKGWRVRVAVRRPDLAAHLQPLGNVGQIHGVQANIRYPKSVLAALEGSDAVVNLVGILHPTGHQGFSVVHAMGAETVAKAAARGGIEHFVHMSALGANSASSATYARTKAEGERRVKKHMPDAVIMRPSVIFGPEDGFLNKFASLAQYMPFLPLIGGGQTKFEPVFVGDVAKAIVMAAEGKAKAGMTYELGGPEIMSLEEIYNFILKVTDRKKMLLPLPFLIAKIQAFFFGMLPNPILTIDQVRLLESDNLVSAKAKKARLTLEGLKITPRSMEAQAPLYLEQYRPTGQYENQAEIR